MNKSSLPNRSADDTRVDRREFGKHVAIGAIASGIAASAANAQEPATPEKPIEPPVPMPLDAADHLLAALTLLHPLPEAPDQRAALLDDLRGIVGRSKALASYPFKNADEPAPIFAAWRAEEGRS